MELPHNSPPYQVLHCYDDGWVRLKTRYPSESVLTVEYLAAMWPDAYRRVAGSGDIVDLLAEEFSSPVPGVHVLELLGYVFVRWTSTGPHDTLIENLRYVTGFRSREALEADALLCLLAQAERVSL